MNNQQQDTVSHQEPFTQEHHPLAADLDLTSEQATKLEQFKEAVSDILQPEHDDHYLLRWLKARNYNVQQAEQMLRKSLTWRQQLGVDSLLYDFEESQVLSQYFPGGLIGCDKEGCPLWIVPLGQLDIKGLFYSVKKTDIIKYTIRMIEMSEVQMREQSERLGKRIDKHMFILDMDNFPMKQLAWKPAVDMIGNLVTLFVDNYPERLKKCYIINAPKMFHVAYGLVKPFLAEETTKKIDVYGTIKEAWQRVLFEEIDSNHLPAYYGGSKVDPDGNPKCHSIIGYGGQIPCSLYTAPSRRMSVDANFRTLIIEKKSVSLIDVNIDQAGTTIKWEFKSIDHDIGFKVYRQRGIDELEGEHSGDDEDTIVPYARVNSHLVPEDGMVTVQTPGKYILKFDNSYSWYTRKRIHYCVQVVPPQQNNSSQHQRPSTISAATAANNSTSAANATAANPFLSTNS